MKKVIFNLNLIDYLFLYALFSIWILLLLNIILAFSGHRYYLEILNERTQLLSKTNIKQYPTISIIIPAHNEELVIAHTMKSMLKLDYPEDKLEIIVVNDNSSDNTGKILSNIKKENPDREIKIITTDKSTGGKGKSNALNIGFKESKGEYIVVYDADNTPESLSLLYLVKTITSNKKLGAVIGKFRTRNKNTNILTRFINIETLSFQWITQAGRWRLLKLCTIPGTNFIIRRDILDKIGGWDIRALAEDTELSFNIYQLGYQIGFMPLAVTWEEEPDRFAVWFRQRLRWVEGNIYVIFKNIKKVITNFNFKVLIDLVYFFAMYFILLSSVLISDIIFFILMFSDLTLTVSGNFLLLWFLAFILFFVEIAIALTMEKGESNYHNYILIILSYISYSQLWIIVVVYGIFRYLYFKITGSNLMWYKTERTKGVNQ